MSRSASATRDMRDTPRNNLRDPRQTVQMIGATRPLPRSKRRGGRGTIAPTTAPVAAPPARARARWKFFLSGMGVACAGVFAGVLLLGGLIERQASLDEAAPSDAIIVLGAAQWNGKPSPVLQARLDHAYELWRRKLAPAIIVTGGTGEGDRFSESQVARQYLVGRGVPPAAILMEERGRSSYESMSAASSLMIRRGWYRATVVSDPFHMLRLKRMGDDLGLRTFTSPTRTSPILPGSDAEWFYKLREVGTLAYYLVARG